MRRISGLVVDVWSPWVLATGLAGLAVVRRLLAWTIERNRTVLKQDNFQTKTPPWKFWANNKEKAHVEQLLVRGKGGSVAHLAPPSH